jgi:hypothetical protein
MWILKGTLLGLWLFGFGTMVWLYFLVYRNLAPHTAVAVSVIAGYTIQNPFCWAAFVVCFVLGNALARAWAGPPILWIALLVTGLIPAGFLALFLMLVVKLKNASQPHL